MSDAIRRSIYITPVDDDRIVNVSAMLKLKGLNSFQKRDGTINRSALFMHALEELEKALKSMLTEEQIAVIYGIPVKRTKKGTIRAQKRKMKKEGQLN